MLRQLLRSTRRYLEKVKDPVPDAHRALFRFGSQEDLDRWLTFSDSELGGKSTASLTLQPGQDGQAGTALLHGEYSTELRGDAETRLKRSGWAGMRSRDTGEILDLGDYDRLVFRLRGDGRKYLANIRTENWLVEGAAHDVWQAFLFAREGEWQEVQVPLSRFLLTWKGRLVESEVEMNPRHVVSIGVALAGGAELQPPGRYALGLDWIAAENSAAAPDRGDR